MSPRGAAREAQKRRRREHLLACAREVFAERGYHGTSVDDIVRRAGVARGTFYLYFADRRAAFEALVDDFFARLTGCIRSIDVAHPTEPPVSQLRANLQRVCALALSEPASLQCVLRDASGLDVEFDRKLAAFYRGLYRFLDESLEVGQRIGLVRSGDRRVMVALAVGGLKQILADAVRGEAPADADALTDEIMRFLSAGLLAPPPPGVERERCDGSAATTRSEGAARHAKETRGIAKSTGSRGSDPGESRQPKNPRRAAGSGSS
ncbi:MAG: TetR/AcrR family transcriptional regulator [Myxococcales bacterium]|nr:TetR/AcrR family transcriptional regulator [Myxococcales bacterium]